VSAPRATASAPRALAPARSSAGAPPTRFADDQGSPRTAPAGSQPVGTAVSRGGGDSGGGSVGGSQPVSSGPETIQSSGENRSAPAGSGKRTATAASGDRARGGRSAVGSAGDRTHPPYGGGGGGGWGGGGYYPPYWAYGGLGLGYFYYDPFWGDPYGGGYYGGGGGGYYGGSGGYSSSQPAGNGELRLKVKPKDAQVYVDGALAGTVDNFDGTFERLTLPEGPHRVELRLDAHQPVSFEVNIVPNELVTYRGKLDPK
jgi:hypothetical protein